MKIYWLDEIKPNERLLVGEKAFALSQMKQLGYPVLPGFVIGSSTLREFLEILGDSEPLLGDLPHTSLHIDIDDYKALQLVAQRSRQEIIAATLPEEWRSTLVAAAKDLNSPTLRMGFSLGLPQSVEQKDRIFSQIGKGSTRLHSFDFGAWVPPLNNFQSCFCKDSLRSKINSAEFSQQLNCQLQPLCQRISHVSEIISSVEDLFHSVVCWCQPEALSVALKQAWSELFSARSLFYWQRSKIELEQLNLAILVQPIRDATASGTIEINGNRASIYSTLGTEHSIIQGEVLPDSYQIELSTGFVEKRNLGNKTIAYRLHTDPSTTDADGSCLFPIELSEKEQLEYALDDRSRTKLIALTQTIPSPKNHCPIYLEWTFCQGMGSEEQSFYLTRYMAFSKPYSISSKLTKPKPLMGDWQLLLVGLAASPGTAIATVQVLASDDRHLNTIEEGRILVAKNILPHWLPLLKKAAGVVTEQGGMTSHGAILARELRVPAIVGAAGATKLLKTGESLLLNGETGEIHRFQGKAENRGEFSHGQLPSRVRSGFGNSLRKTNNNYPIATQLMVNLSATSSIANAAALPVDGVGLVRSELMLQDLVGVSEPIAEWLFGSKKLHLLDKLTELITQLAAAFTPRPLFYRSTDWRYPEFPPQTDAATVSSNPILRNRGTYNYVLDSTLFDLELEAIARTLDSGYSNVNLILPFVRSVEEFSFCRRRLETRGIIDKKSFQLWIMAEVPSIIFLLPQYVEAGVQGISIGTNDLTQLLLGVDREEAMVSTELNARHPAMLKAIEQLIRQAKKAGIPCSICGQAPVQYPEIIDQLVQWGITSISVEPEAVERTYQGIANAEQRLLLEAARLLMTNDQ